MRTPGPQPIELIPRAGHRVGEGSAADAANRPAVPANSILRQPTDDGVSGAGWGDGQSQASSAAHGGDGPGGPVPQATDHDPGAGRTRLPQLAPRSGADPRRRGLEFGHHLCADAAWIHVPDRGISPEASDERRGSVPSGRIDGTSKGPRLGMRMASRPVVSPETGAGAVSGKPPR